MATDGAGREGGDPGVKAEGSRRNAVYMCGYLPGASPEKSPMLSPTPVRDPAGGDSWKDVFGGGCGFAMAVSGEEFVRSLVVASANKARSMLLGLCSY